MKGTRHERAAKQALSDEAAEWFIRLRDERLATRLRARNVRWLKESPANIAELLRMQQVHALLRECKVENRTPPAGAESEPDELSNVIELMPRQPRPHEPVEARSRLAPWKIAAAVACLTVAFLLGFSAGTGDSGHAGGTVQQTDRQAKDQCGPRAGLSRWLAGLRASDPCRNGE
ncbi:MAG TPA: FecR/PupR family sigma factor regulator [Steroidobacter sp.]|uniref:FecR/PupR family sigma factor regulator n=1 Tax=Steroidobacter sp. TaxID=1978227 RepID=UPI002EDACDDC